MKRVQFMGLLLLVLLAPLLHAQIKVSSFNFTVDYNNTSFGVWNQSERLRVSSGMELSISDLFSWEAKYSFDGNGYTPFTYSLGNSYYNFWGGNPYNRIYNDLYTGMRIYPIDNYHSQAIQLRNKKNYGFYFAYGYRVSVYNRYEFGLEYVSEPVIDANGNQVLNDDGSVVMQSSVEKFDTWRWSLYQWGVNFGCGFKMYQSKYMYTDFGVYSDMFSTDNRMVTGHYSVNMDQRIVSQQMWEEYLSIIESMAKNGRGIEVRMNIGINLDIKR